MATIKFRLRTEKTNQQGFTPVALFYAEKGQECAIATGISILAADWDPDKPDAPVRKSCTDYARHNLALSSLKAEVQKIINDFYVRQSPFRYPTKAEMRQLYDQRNDLPVDANASPEIEPLFTRFRTHQSENRGLENVCYGTAKNYIKVINRLKAYGQHLNRTLTLADIDKDFYPAFSSYCMQHHGNGANTIGSYTRIIKTFLSFCEDELNIKVDSKVRDSIQVPVEENWFTWFTIDELAVIASKDFHTSPFHERTRDAFILQSCIGCRYGDVANRIDKNVIIAEGVHYLQMTTGKNQKNVRVPLAPVAIAILQKYKGTPAQQWVPNNTYYNRYIKEVAQLCGFTQILEVTVGRGNQRKEFSTPRYMLVTSHTARRTFINVMLEHGVPDADICAITGQSLLTLQRYKHANTSRLAPAMNRIWNRPELNQAIATGLQVA